MNNYDIVRSFIVVAVVIVASVQHIGAQPPSVSATTPAALDEATQLTTLVEKLYDEGKYKEAVSIAERALAIREKALGPDHRDVAESLSNLGSLYLVQGAHARAEPLLVRALAIRERALGPVHREVAESLNDLARLYREQGMYAKTEALDTRALAIREQVLGPNHREVAESLNNLAEVYQVQGAYAKAEPLHLRALAIREQVLGPHHPDVANSLNNLARIYEDQGAYARAEVLFIRAIDIVEQALGPGHRTLATDLNNLAELYRAEGAYSKAEPLYLRALDIYEKALGPSHPDTARSLNNLALLHRAQGAYGKAESLLIRALDINEKAQGPGHPDVAMNLNNLAALYGDQGAYAKAESLLVRAIDINEKALGPGHPRVANSLGSLASLYRRQRMYGRAEPLLIRVREIFEKALGPGHPDVASAMSRLAAVYADQDAYAKAESLLVHALAIREKALGAVHRDVAATLTALALVYRAQGRYAEAEPLLVRALDVYEKALGPRHPSVATCLGHLAVLYEAQGAYARAEPLLARTAEIQEQQLRNDLGRLSAARKRELMSTIRDQTDVVLSFHLHEVPTSAAAAELAFTTVLRRKGRGLDSLVDNQAGVRAHLTPHLQGRLDELAQARSELVARLYAPSDRSGSTPASRAAVDALRTRIDELEAVLSEASDELRIQTAPVTVAAVQAALPADAALVELVRYRRVDPRKQPLWQDERYAVYLLTRHGPPRWVALGEAAPVDAAIDAVLATMDVRVPVASAKAALQRLDALVLAPVRAQLSGISHVILAPDDKLNLVPFEALVDADGRYALEHSLVSYVSSGRDLLRLTPAPPRSPAVIIAGPDYGPAPISRGIAALSFERLPGAAAEATDLRKYFPAAPVIGARATKGMLAGLVGPAVVHIATHGFYGRPTETAGASGAALSPARGRSPRGMKVIGSPPPLSSPPSQPSPAEDPIEGLDHSGLAMAGANRGGDGIVTAREVAGFDWQGTQLVVLSACQTGVGAVPSGDGVYGLRRALVLAGAASQVVSLWGVSDAATRALMRDYYGELTQGTGRAEALRMAQLRALRRSSTAHPYYWAAFIPAGDWRPLDANVLSPQSSTR